MSSEIQRELIKQISLGLDSKTILDTELANIYFDPKPWERSGIIYKILGVPVIKKCLLDFSDKLHKKQPNINQEHYDELKQSNPYRLLQNTTEGIIIYERRSRKFETIHNIGVGIGIATLYRFIESPHLDLITGVAILSGVGNLYAVMLQRFNRERIYRIKKRYYSRPNE